MKRIVAQFRPVWRPTRLALGGLAFLALATAAAVGVDVWEYGRIASLQNQIAQLTGERSVRTVQPASEPAPPYDASARQFLRERAAGWAPMLRTLESGAMIGVTPTSVEFNARDRVARVQLAYVDSKALLDYLERINEGVADEQGKPRWVLVEAHEDGDRALDSPAQLMEQKSRAVATIRSVWLDEPPPPNR